MASLRSSGKGYSQFDCDFFVLTGLPRRFFYGLYRHFDSVTVTRLPRCGRRQAAKSHGQERH